MIEYKTKASEANIFLSQNDMSFPAHHYMYVDPYYNKKVTLRNILDTYQEYMFTRHKIDIKLKLDETIPNELKVTEDMKFSEYFLMLLKIK